MVVGCIGDFVGFQEGICLFFVDGFVFVDLGFGVYLFYDVVDIDVGVLCVNVSQCYVEWFQLVSDFMQVVLIIYGDQLGVVDYQEGGVVNVDFIFCYGDKGGGRSS